MAESPFSISTPGGAMGGTLFVPAGSGPWPGVIFYQDGFGVRGELAAMARRLAALGYAVALPNLYYSLGPMPPLDPAAVMAGGPERDRLMALVSRVTVAQVMRDTGLLLTEMDRRSEIRPGAWGCVGYCMGGRFALSAAGAHPDRIGAAASFHGSRLAIDAPDSPHLGAEQMRARLYIGVAGLDAGFPPEQGALLVRSLMAAGRDFAFEVYAGARHGFAIADHPVYDAAAAARHWQRLSALFAEALL